MKPPPLDYEAPETLDRAVELLAGSDDAKALAGGQSLVPLLSLRLAYPDLLVDLRRIPGLQSVDADGADLVLGSMVSQRRAELDPEIGKHCPLLVEALRHVAHPQIRTRGTVGGSIAHADPASELPATLLALGGRVRVEGPGGSRTIDADDLFAGLLTTSLEAGELITAVELPVAAPEAGAACVEVARRRGDYAIAGCVAEVELDAGVVFAARMAFFGVADRPLRRAEIEGAAVGKGPSEAPEAAMAAAVETIEPSKDPELSTDYRRHLVGVVTRRALARALKEAK
jgi:aerobic carbon-monoxide dehydrogenase medium subunit